MKRLNYRRFLWTVIPLAMLSLTGLSGVNSSHVHASVPRSVSVYHQKASALVNAKTFRYDDRHNHYPLVNNRRDANVNIQGVNYTRHDNHKAEKLRGSHHVTFRTRKFLPHQVVTDNRVNELYSPQSLVVTPNGHYAYVAYNAYNSNQKKANGQPSKYSGLRGNILNLDRHGRRYERVSYVNRLPHYRHLHDGAVQVVRFNLRSKGLVLPASRSAVRVGPVFYGGHGQALGYNQRNRQIWLLNNRFGAARKTSVENLNPSTLSPNRKVSFKLPTPLGDNLTFNGRGQAINFDEVESKKGSFVRALHALKVFYGRVKNSSVRLKLVKQGIRYAPGDVIQATSYNPRNHRIYIVSDDTIMSVPADRFGKLRPRDVHEIHFHSKREFEGLAFDHKGRAYLLLNRSPEILESSGLN